MDADGFGELPLRFACRIKAAGADTGDERLGVYTEPVIERDWLEIAMNDGGGREFVEFVRAIVQRRASACAFIIVKSLKVSPVHLKTPSWMVAEPRQTRRKVVANPIVVVQRFDQRVEGHRLPIELRQRARALVWGSNGAWREIENAFVGRNAGHFEHRLNLRAGFERCLEIGHTPRKPQPGPLRVLSGDSEGAYLVGARPLRSMD